jgi:hypothetical protein
MLDASIFRDQMTVRRLRLGAGLIMLCYLTLHFCMHALGNVSFEAMEWGTQIHDFVWHSVVAATAEVKMSAFPVREISVRGRTEPLAVRIVSAMNELVA